VRDLIFGGERGDLKIASLRELRAISTFITFIIYSYYSFVFYCLLGDLRGGEQVQVRGPCSLLPQAIGARGELKERSGRTQSIGSHER